MNFSALSSPRSRLVEGNNDFYKTRTGLHETVRVEYEMSPGIWRYRTKTESEASTRRWGGTAKITPSEFWALFNPHTALDVWVQGE